MKKLLTIFIALGVLVPAFAFATTQADCDAMGTGWTLQGDICINQSARNPAADTQAPIVIQKAPDSVAPSTGNGAQTGQSAPITTGGNANAFCTGGTCTYVPLEPVPCGNGQAPGSCESGKLGFAGLLAAAFKLIVTLGSLFAVILLVIAGISHMTSSTPLTLAKANERAWRAIQGLLLLGAAWLIVYTINPQLLNFNLLTQDLTSNSVNPLVANQTPVATQSGTPNPTADNSVQFKQGCSGAGGESASSPSGAVCFLPNTKDEAGCTTAGGSWARDWTFAGNVFTKHCEVNVKL